MNTRYSLPRETSSAPGISFPLLLAYTVGEARLSRLHSLRTYPFDLAKEVFDTSTASSIRYMILKVTAKI